MQILLEATNEAKKLRPLTNLIPSAMLPITNRPLMTYTLESCARQGHTNFILALDHLAGHIESYFKNGERWNVSLQYILQKTNRGNGNFLKLAQTFIQDDPILLLPADILIDIDINDLIKQHKKNKSILTVVALQNDFQYQTDQSGKIKEINPSYSTEEDRQPSQIYLIEPDLLSFIPANQDCDIAKDIIPKLIASNAPIYIYQTQGYYNPLNTFQQYYNANKALLNPVSRKHPPVLQETWLHTTEVAEGIFVDRHQAIHPSVSMLAPIVVGEKCQIGAGVTVGANTILGNNVIIDNNATISQSIVLDNTYIGELVNLEKRIIYNNLVIDIESGASLVITDEFLVSKTYKALTDTGIKQLLDKLLAFFLLLITTWFTIPLALLCLIFSKRVFTKTTRFHYKPVQGKTLDNYELQTVQLLNFATTNQQDKTTYFGQWLRTWEFDRLPELWNVVNGNLAFIGMKPLTEAEILQVSEPWQQKRYEEQLGFTGLWYVNTKEESQLDDILIADVYYCVTKNWRENVKLLFKMPKSWLDRHRSFSVRLNH